MTRARVGQLQAGLFLAPALTLLGLFVVWPMIRLALSSVFATPLLLPARTRWIGLEQFADLALDPRFLRAVLNSAKFSLFVVPVQTTAALLLALWSNRPEAAYRALGRVFLVPTLVAMPVSAVVWTALYQPSTGAETGALNALISVLGLPPQGWLSDTRWAMPAIGFMSVWQGVGLQTLVLSAGLKSIPREMLDAAELDGAGPWSRLRYITLPALRNSLVFVVTVTTIFSFRLFAQPYLMTRGGPRERTLSIVQWIYETTFVEHDLGHASAASLLLLGGVAGVTLIQRRFFREESA